MIDFATEQLLTLAEAAVTVRISLATAHRWRLRGVRGVKLSTCVIGARRYTSREALQRFIEESTVAADGKRAVPRTPRQRRRAVERAEEELRRVGI